MLAPYGTTDGNGVERAAPKPKRGAGRPVRARAGCHIGSPGDGGAAGT